MSWEVTTAYAADHENIVARVKQGTLSVQDLFNNFDNIRGALGDAAIARYRRSADHMCVEILTVEPRIIMQGDHVSSIVELLRDEGGIKFTEVSVDIRDGRICWHEYGDSELDVDDVPQAQSDRFA